MNLNYPEVARMTVSQFRAFKRAVLVLTHAGIEFNAAVEILLEANAKRQEYIRPTCPLCGKADCVGARWTHVEGPCVLMQIQRRQHERNCPAYGNYQPPYEECTCGAERSTP